MKNHFPGSIQHTDFHLYGSSAEKCQQSTQHGMALLQWLILNANTRTVLIFDKYL